MTRVLAAPQRRLGLRSWLAGLPAPSPEHLLLGGTGHLLLSLTEQAQARNRLQTEVLPSLLADPSLRRVSLITGLAPGADLLFKRLAIEWLEQAGIVCEAVALLPVPVDVLIGDWVEKSHDEWAPVSGAELDAMRRLLEGMLADCDVIVDLLPPRTTAVRLQQLRFRQSQYRRLAACLAEQAGVLVALLREQHPLQPGGSAEIVEWRRDPGRIPPAFSTLALRQPPVEGRRLLLVDLSHPESAANRGAVRSADDALEPAASLPRREAVALVLGQCQQSLKSGNYLLAYDQARRGQARGLNAPSLDYISLLALANAGSTQLALKRFRELGIAEFQGAEDWLALEGRLLKDLAVGGSADSAALFLRSGEAYHEAFRRTGGYFTAINAATMLLLGGRRKVALRLAEDVLARIVERAAADETEAYYLRVTEAEAALLLGDLMRCRQCLSQADGLLRGNLNVRSRTVSQLRLVCRHFGVDEALLNALTLAPVIYVQRPGPGQSENPALPTRASFVFSGLTLPAELAIVEHFLRRRARLHLVLPSPRAELVDHWQRHHGKDWAMRLGECLDRAGELSVAQGFLDEEDRWCADYVSAMALGLSRLAAKRLGCQWQSVDPAAAGDDHLQTARDPGATFPGQRKPDAGASSAGSAAAAGARLERLFIGVLFADFTGYSRLSEIELPQFQTLFLGAIAAILSRWKAQILSQRTWGDAVHVVTVNAESAADIASEIQTSLDQLRAGLGGSLAQLELRLAAHYAPVYAGLDPVEGTPVYFGSQLSFTARIEPVTPPGMIFVTEAFAARLALEAPARFTVEYAGEIDLAKRFGKYRLFSLRRLPGAPG